MMWPLNLLYNHLLGNEPRSANQQDEARADIHARGLWGQRQSAFFDVRVFHPNVSTELLPIHYPTTVSIPQTTEEARIWRPH